VAASAEHAELERPAEVLVADVGRRVRRRDAVGAQLGDEPVELVLVARHETHGEPLAPEAAGDGEAEVGPGPHDHDRHAG